LYKKAVGNNPTWTLKKFPLISAKIVGFLQINSDISPADILSKHWSYSQVWDMLRQPLFCR